MIGQGEETVRELIREVDRRIERLSQIIVVNTKSTYSLPDDYPEFSVRTEYLSDAELNQILKGFRDAGLVTDLYIGEMNFIRALVGGKVSAPTRDLVVYNTVTSGTWHGRDTLIPAVCGEWNVAYCGGDAYAMAVAGNKYYALRMAERCGENTGGITLYRPGMGWCNGSRPPSGGRVIIKPALECASIGIDENAVVPVDENLESVLDERGEMMGQSLLVQPFVPGYEIEVPVYGVPRPLAPAAFGLAVDGERDLGDRFLTYDAVYHDRYAYYRLAGMDAALDGELRESACRVFNELGLHGFARIDYRVRENGTWVLTDINAVPHLTPDASPSLAFATLGLSYQEVLKLVTAAGMLRLPRS